MLTLAYLQGPTIPSVQLASAMDKKMQGTQRMQFPIEDAFASKGTYFQKAMFGNAQQYRVLLKL